MRSVLLPALTAVAVAASSAEVPAVLVEVDAASRAALLAAVTRLLPGPPPLLADDALTTTSWLILERARRESVDGVVEPGFDLERPEQFRLVLRDGRCELVRLSTGTREVLAGARCAPQPESASGAP